MALLRRLLYIDALTTVAVALVALPFPGFLAEDVLGVSSNDHTMIRLLGGTMLGMALLMVLVGHRVQELWWWCWAFVVVEAGWGIALTLEAAFGLPQEAHPAAWWVAAAVAWLFGFGFLLGIGRAADEVRP